MIGDRLTIILYLIINTFVLGQSKGEIDLNNLENYANQIIPDYITKDNTPSNNPITDAGATLGRVLFYDKKLSINDLVSCSSCHKQSFGFGDPNKASIGVNGNTPRHSMRLINSRFSEEVRFFWDKRAETLEDQIIFPLRDHVEMGFSGENGDPSFDSLLSKLNKLDYYKTLFEFAFGNEIVTEDRIKKALAQFVRSIQSFDSKYDEGRKNGDARNSFTNFTDEEKAGKDLFEDLPIFDQNSNRIGGGFGCAQCHRPPEFDIDPQSLSNSMIFSLGNTNLSTDDLDVLVTKAPSLRGVFNPDGETGFLMHNAFADNFDAALNVYSKVINLEDKQLANLIDPRLRPNQIGQKLNLTIDEINQITSFMKTLTGSDVYTNPKWSNPFDSSGNIKVIAPNTTSIRVSNGAIFQGYILEQNYPNPFNPTTTISYTVVGTSHDLSVRLTIYDILGKEIATLVNEVKTAGAYKVNFDASNLTSGVYYYQLKVGDFMQTNKMILLK